MWVLFFTRRSETLGNVAAPTIRSVKLFGLFLYCAICPGVGFLLHCADYFKPRFEWDTEH